MARLATLLAVTVALCCGLAADAAEVRRAIGHARGIDAGARDRAMDMAVREAVLEAIQERIPSQRITPYESLLDRAHEFVQDLRIVDYDTRDGISTMEISVWLREGSLRSAIARAWLQEAAVKPRVVVLAASREEGDAFQVNAGDSSQATLESELGKAGLEVTGLEELTRHEDLPDLARMAANAFEAGPGLARAHLADAAVLILATTTAEPVHGSTNVFAVTARVEMVVASPSGDGPIHTETSEALMHGADPGQAAMAAINSATARLAQRAFPWVVLAAAAAEPRGDDIILTVEGALDAAQLEALIDHCAAIDGVEEVETLLHARRAVRLRVKFPANPSGFIEPALRALPPTLPLEAMHIVDREMHLRLRDGAP
jgi:hypothetical protein